MHHFGQRLQKIKLDAFPYQKFGLATGKVAQVAESPILVNEMSPTTKLFASVENSEAYYAVHVNLDRQQVEINKYGETRALRPGMQLTAEIELDTRKLYEWVLEPLYGMARHQGEM